MKKLLLVSDLHTRSDSPVCRTDNFSQIQVETLMMISDIANRNDATIIFAGDIFHRPKPLLPQYLETLLHDIFLHNEIYFIMGNPNHDLKDSNYDNLNYNSIGVMGKFFNWMKVPFLSVEKGVIIEFFDFGKEITKCHTVSHNRIKICVLHKFVSDQPLPPWLEDRGITAKDLCKKHRDYDLFVTGDNHKSFVYEDPETGQQVINCGCITRQKLSEKDYKPCVYLYDIEKRAYEEIIKLPDTNPNVIRKSNNSKLQEERESRIDSFLQLAGNKKEITWDYPANLRTHCKKNKVEDEVVTEINNILEEVHG